MGSVLICNTLQIQYRQSITTFHDVLTWHMYLRHVEREKLNKYSSSINPYSLPHHPLSFSRMSFSLSCHVFFSVKLMPTRWFLVMTLFWIVRIVCVSTRSHATFRKSLEVIIGNVKNRLIEVIIRWQFLISKVVYWGKKEVACSTLTSSETFLPQGRTRRWKSYLRNKTAEFSVVIINILNSHKFVVMFPVDSTNSQETWKLENVKAFTKRLEHELRWHLNE